MANNVQWKRFPLYDYIRYPAAGTTSLTFFSVPLGGTDPVSSSAKTFEQTNVQKSGQLGYPFVIHQFRLDVRLLPKTRQPAAISALTDYVWDDVGDAASALENLLGQGVLNFKIGQKSYFDINKPFRTCKSGFGVSLPSDAGAAGAVHVQQAEGKPYAVTPPQYVAPDQIITVTVDFFNATSPALTGLIAGADPRLEVGLILDGYAGFAVQ
jgi:hypothetical protein